MEHFVRTLGIRSANELRRADHKAMFAWRAYMRATFITTALENGCSLEDAHRAASQADPSTTRLYDRRGYDPERSASFFANH